MVTKKRIDEIRASGFNLTEITRKEMAQTIAEGNKMSRENSELFSSMLL